MIWENTTKEDITNFFHTANNFHHLLKFTHLLSKQVITFWDTTVYKGKRFTKSKILDIKTHTKPMEMYQYLHRTSCHPDSVFCGFIKGTVISRIRTNSDPENVSRKQSTDWAAARGWWIWSMAESSVFSSKNGIVTVLSVNGRNSKVIDTETLANHCDACAKHKHKKGVAEFEQWHKTHTQRKLCEKNQTGSAGSMEPAGTETIFCRSVTKYGLRYTRYLGDGDSKLFSRVKNAQPPVYDNTDITKLKCCGHVQKRMGCYLTNKVSELKNTSFVHTGKIVKELVAEVKIWKIPGHYGAAIRNNVGHLPATKAVWAIWEHCNRQHDSCGTWCPSKKADCGDPNKNALLPYVMEAIKPIFSTLADESLLEKCLYGGTQNTNESFHHHMGMLPKNNLSWAQPGQAGGRQSYSCLQQWWAEEIEHISKTEHWLWGWCICNSVFHSLGQRQNQQSMYPGNATSEETETTTNARQCDTRQGYRGVLLVRGSWIDEASN